MTPEQLAKLQSMQRGLTLYIGALTQIENHHQRDMEARRAVAERGRLLQIALEDLCKELETEGAAPE